MTPFAPPARAAFVLLAGFAAAQDPVARLRAEAGERLHEQARIWFAAGFPLRAKKLWLELIADYDQDDARAWQALGYQRFGVAWVPDAARPFPERDSAAPSRVRPLERGHEATIKALGEAHRRAALELERLGRAAEAVVHWRRVLRFLPGDVKAGERLGYRAIDGMFVSAEELELLARSRRLGQAVAFLRETAFPVEVLPEGEQHARLALAGVPYRGVRSPHFTVWGDLEQKELEAAALAAERCLWLCRTAFVQAPAANDDPLAVRELAFFRTLETWQGVVRANAALFEASHLRFLLDHCLAAYLVDGTRCVYAAHAANHDLLLDQTVRAVAADLANVRSAALKDGVGHAVVAMFFGRNLGYLIDKLPRPEPQSHRTEVAPAPAAPGDAGGLVLPDLDAWADAAIQQAWSRDGVPAAQLPLLAPERFTQEQRVKAWAWCDWVLRREPRWLHWLDDAGQGAPGQGEVAREFERLAGKRLPEAEAEWRRFWIEESRLLHPLLERKRTPSALDKQALPWLRAINSVRLAAELCPLGWLEGDAPAARALAQALRGGPSPESEALGQEALVAQGGKPADAVATALARPGYRHALVNPDLDVVGFQEASGLAILDLSREQLVKRSSQAAWPRGGMEVPSKVAADSVGPAVRALLAAQGKGDAPWIGYPLTLHFFGPEVGTKVECLVGAGGARVIGVLHASNGNGDRRNEARGLVTFYPLEPLPAGVEIEAAWSWSEANGARMHREARLRAR